MGRRVAGTGGARVTALAWILALYLTGIAWLLLLDIADRVYLEPLARAVWALLRRAPYAGRHRAGECWSTSQTNVALAAERERQSATERALREDTRSMFLPVFVDEAPLCPPMYPRYDHRLGAGRYAHLRVEELDAKAERDLRRAKVAVPA